MKVLRTPDERFRNLPDFPFAPHYVAVAAADGTALRVHYLDEGPRDGEILLCMHGQPSWSFLYRKMIPLLTGAGFRVIAPDLVGFGRSDKPAERGDYTYAAHVDWMTQWFDALDLSDVTLVCQDWGGLIGLRVAASRIGRFRRLVVANTGLPDSKAVRPEMSAMLAAAYPQIPVPSAADVIEQFRTGERAAFLYWVKYASECPEFSVRDVFGILSRIDDEAVLDGYAAPFPDDRYAAGARQFPSLVPLMPRHEPDRLANDAAWEVLEAYTGPVLTAFSDRDFVTRGGEKPFQQRIPGARGVSHVTIEGGGHFLQEDSAEAFANAIIEFVRQHP